MPSFKPMVKMQTTEPSVELKLKKGGSVAKEKKMQMGGALAPTATPAPMGMPGRGGDMAAAAPMPPSLAERRRRMRGMPAGAAPAAPVGPAARMMKEGGESKKEHAAEMKKMAKTEKELKAHEAKPASKAHKGLATGGVAKAQGGYKTGGVAMGQGGYKHGGKIKKYAKGGIITEEEGARDAGPYRNTLVHTAKGDKSGAKTGGVKMGNAGGYKKGGAAKKYAKGGAVNDSGKAESMPQGHKKPSSPVSITRLSGTFKKGGEVMTPAEKRLTKKFDEENAPAMKAAKAKDVEVYSKFGKKMRYGGSC